MFVLGKQLQPRLMFAGEDHLKCASLELAPALFAKVKLGWSVLSGANTLAFYKHLQITTIKSFITLGKVLPLDLL